MFIYFLKKKLSPWISLAVTSKRCRNVQNFILILSSLLTLVSACIIFLSKNMSILNSKLIKLSDQIYIFSFSFCELINLIIWIRNPKKKNEKEKNESIMFNYNPFLLEKKLRIQKENQIRLD